LKLSQVTFEAMQSARLDLSPNKGHDYLEALVHLHENVAVH